MLGACDARRAAQLLGSGYPYWAIRLLRLVDPKAPDKAARPGEMNVNARALSEEGLDYLLHVSRRLLRNDTNKPAYGLRTEDGVADAIEFTLQGKTLRFSIPKAANLLGEEGCAP